MMVQTEEREPKPVSIESRLGEHSDPHLERDDNRWSRAAQARDWLWLILMIVIYLVWVGIIYFLEPGIR